MKPLYFIALITGILAMACTSDNDSSNVERNNLDLLEAEIQQLTDETEGWFGIAFIDIQQPDRNIFINADDWFHAASTMKTPVIIEVYRQAQEGKLNLDDPIPVKNEFVSIADGSTYSLSVDRDSGDALYEHLGSELSIRELVYSMIVHSGNLATNLVVEKVGADNVNRTMEEIGAEGILVLRGVEDMPAFTAGMNNETTARGLAVMFQKLAGDEILDDAMRQEVISVLKDQYHREMIPAGLPEDVEVAHKTGSITGITHDSGIVYLPDGRQYVLVVLAKDLPEHNVGHEAGARISRLVYEFMTQ